MPGNVVTLVGPDGTPLAVTGGALDVNSAAPVGGATEAKQDAMILLVDTVEALLADIRAAVQLIDNTVAGGELQVDIVSSAAGGDASAANQVLQTTELTAVNAKLAASLPLPTGAATAALQLPDGHAVTVDNAVGASAVPIQDGGNSITVDATALPLPTGAATAALQLPNSHDVTIDNASGASAVNIQDGGNIITVDGTVAITNTVLAQNQGKTVTRFVLSQGAPGTTQIAAAVVGSFHKIYMFIFTMDVAGTVKFTDGVSDLTGAMNVGATGGFVAVSTPTIPIIETLATNRAINIVTTGGGADGIILLVTEP